MWIRMLANVPLCLMAPDRDKVAGPTPVLVPTVRFMDGYTKLVLKNADQAFAKRDWNGVGDAGPSNIVDMNDIDLWFHRPSRLISRLRTVTPAGKGWAALRAVSSSREVISIFTR